MTKKTKKEKKSKAPPAASPKTRHVDSVVLDDDEAPPSGRRSIQAYAPSVAAAAVEVVEDAAPARRELAVLPASSNVPMVAEPALVRAAARDLILQAKTALSKKAGHFPSHVSLVLENDVEVDAGMMLEQMGRGRLFKDGEEWVFEFNEEGGVGGILKGDVLQNKD